jgi:hypothetical protein
MQVLQSVREENSENLSAGCRGEILKGFLFRKVSFCKIIQFLIVNSTFLHCIFIVQQGPVILTKFHNFDVWHTILEGQ